MTVRNPSTCEMNKSEVRIPEGGEGRKQRREGLSTGGVIKLGVYKNGNATEENGGA